MIPKGLIIATSVGITTGGILGLFFIDFKTNSQLEFVDGSSLSIVTEKIDFKKGEIISITLVNSGTIPLRADEPSFDLKISGLDGVEMYSPRTVDVPSVIEPRNDVTFTWDQIKNNGEAAHEGVYKISAVGFDSNNKAVKKSITVNIWK